MSESTAAPTRNDTWTIDTYAAHNEALRHAELRFQDERLRWMEERDRRYSEVKNAEEKALRIKEEADRTALGLQRENQQYRDEKGNELRAQIERERGSYATRHDLTAAVEKLEATLKPLAEYVTGQLGARSQVVEQRAQISAVQAFVAVLVSIIAAGVLFLSLHKTSTPIVIQPTVTAPSK